MTSIVVNADLRKWPIYSIACCLMSFAVWEPEIGSNLESCPMINLALLRYSLLFLPPSSVFFINACVATATRAESISSWSFGLPMTRFGREELPIACKVGILCLLKFRGKIGTGYLFRSCPITGSLDECGRAFNSSLDCFWSLSKSIVLALLVRGIYVDPSTLLYFAPIENSLCEFISFVAP